MSASPRPLEFLYQFHVRSYHYHLLGLKDFSIRSTMRRRPPAEWHNESLTKLMKVRLQVVEDTLDQIEWSFVLRLFRYRYCKNFLRYVHL